MPCHRFSSLVCFYSESIYRPLQCNNEGQLTIFGASPNPQIRPARGRPGTVASGKSNSLLESPLAALLFVCLLPAGASGGARAAGSRGNSQQTEPERGAAAGEQGRRRHAAVRGGVPAAHAAAVLAGGAGPVALAGATLWVDCEAGYASSTYCRVPCGSRTCRLLRSQVCSLHGHLLPRAGPVLPQRHLRRVPLERAGQHERERHHRRAVARRRRSSSPAATRS
jgi:hypothetical protein